MSRVRATSVAGSFTEVVTSGSRGERIAWTRRHATEPRFNSGVLERAHRTQWTVVKSLIARRSWGSNPTPATIASGQEPRFGGASLVSCSVYRRFYRVEVGRKDEIRGRPTRVRVGLPTRGFARCPLSPRHFGDRRRRAGGLARSPRCRRSWASEGAPDRAICVA